ncbi:MAG: DUF167 domain-containing protein [Candidatus Uhrbacteria bacterium]|nr:DUF167 domain-containing protein [Candidatus Uhrbacteria bacterium]
MKLTVKVKTGARENTVKKIDETSYAVAVKARPIEGKANEAVIKAIAEYFDIPKSRVGIQSGHSSSQKIIAVSHGYDFDEGKKIKPQFKEELKEIIKKSKNGKRYSLRNI